MVKRADETTDKPIKTTISPCQIHVLFCTNKYTKHIITVNNSQFAGRVQYVVTAVGHRLLIFALQCGIAWTNVREHANNTKTREFECIKCTWIQIFHLRVHVRINSCFWSTPLRETIHARPKKVARAREVVLRPRPFLNTGLRFTGKTRGVFLRTSTELAVLLRKREFYSGCREVCVPRMHDYRTKIKT